MRLSDFFEEPLVGRKQTKKVGDARHRLVFSHTLVREMAQKADREGRRDAKALLDLAAKSVMTAIRALDRAAGRDLREPSSRKSGVAKVEAGGGNLS